MSKQATDWAESLPTLPTGVKPLLVHLARFARKDDHTCYRAQEVIAESIDQSLSTVKRNIKWLRQNSLITTKPAYKEGVRVADEITLNVGAALGVNLTRSQVSNRPLKMATLGVKSDDLRCQKHGGQVSLPAFSALSKQTNKQNIHSETANALAALKKENDFLVSENEAMKAEIASLKNQLAQAESAAQTVYPVAVVEAPKATKTKTEKQQVSADTWLAYANAYFNRYGVEPIRNAKVNGQISKFVDLVGLSMAPVLARYYINLNTPYYLQKSHDFGLALADAQAINTQYLSGRQITRKDIQRVEASQTAANLMHDLTANGEPW
jgi:cell division septum initiation protein DivIVA